MRCNITTTLFVGHCVYNLIVLHCSHGFIVFIGLRWPKTGFGCGTRGATVSCDVQDVVPATKGPGVGDDQVTAEGVGPHLKQEERVRHITNIMSSMSRRENIGIIALINKEIKEK